MIGTSIRGKEVPIKWWIYDIYLSNEASEVDGMLKEHSKTDEEVMELLSRFLAEAW